MLQTKALIVNVNISQWSGRKHDKKITREVEETHNAEQGEAGRFNKMLTSKEFLAGTSKAASAARQFLYEKTLPWSDNGDRLLTTEMYFDFIKEFSIYIETFNKEVDKAEQALESEIEKRKIQLNGMFNAADYPRREEFKSKFNLRVTFMPIPEISDFRIDLSQTEVNVLTKNIENEMNNRLTAAVSSTWERIKEQLTKMKETLSTQDKIFRDSLFNNLADLISILPKLNVTNDANINQICADMETLLVSPEAVRTNSNLRNEKAIEVQNLLNKFDSFF